MNDETFARLRELSPGVVDAARAIAAGAVNAMPRDLEPTEEPAHVFRAAPADPDGTEQCP